MEQQISDMWAQVWVTAGAGLLQCALIAGGLWMMKLSGERRDRQLDLMEAAPRALAGLVVRRPFPPAAERCPWTGVESSSRARGGPPAAASSANTWSQPPLCAQRTNRLYRVLDGP